MEPEGAANRDRALAILARLADEDNWRDVMLESDDQTDYDAMAWSPMDCDIDEEGRMSDPLFHKPWKLAAEAALLICPANPKGESDEGLPK